MWVGEEMKKMKMFCCVKNRLSLCLVIVNGHSSADTVLKTNSEDVITGT